MYVIFFLLLLPKLIAIYQKIINSEKKTYLNEKLGIELSFHLPPPQNRSRSFLSFDLTDFHLFSPLLTFLSLV